MISSDDFQASSRTMTTLGGKAWHGASVIRLMDASAQPLLLTALAGTVGLNTKYARWR